MRRNPTAVRRWIAVAFAAFAVSGDTAGTAPWTVLGPPGGGIAGVAIDPSDANVAYTKDTGINRTVDGGATWTPLVLDVRVTDLAFDPANSQTLYVSGMDSLGEGGVYKSADQGATWSRLTLPPGASGHGVRSLTAGTTPGVLLAGLDSRGGLLRSTDGGTSWTTNTSVVTLSQPDVLQLAFQPGSALVVYALIGEQFLGNNSLLRSNDGGASWAPTSLGASAPATMFVTGLSIFLAGQSGALRSDDGGFSAVGLGNFTGERRIVADAAGSRVWLASTDGVRVSNDAGATWVLAPTLPLTDLAVASNATTLYASTTENGVLRSNDAGATWGPTAGINALFPYDVAIDATAPGTIYAATMDAGVKKSTDGGATWSTANTGLAMPCASQIEVDPLNPSVLYVVAIDGIYKSTDGAQHWTLIWTAPASYSIELIAADPDHSGTVLASTTWGLYRTTDGGATWTKVGSHDIRGQAIAFAGNQSSIVYVGGGAKVWRSADNGVTWASLPTGFPASYVSAGRTFPFIVYALGVDPNDADVVYAGTNGPGVFKTTDGGQTWNAMNAGLIQRDVRAFAFDSGNSHIVYLSTEGMGGVWRSSDAAAHWAPFSDGLVSAASKVIFPLVADMSPPFIIYGGSRAGVITYAFAPPRLAIQAADAIGVEGTQLRTAGSFVDPDADPISVAASIGEVLDNGDGSWTWTVQPKDNVVAQSVVVTATDSHGATATQTFAYTAANAVPVLAPPSVDVTGCGVSLSFSFVDAGVLDTHAGTIEWGDGTSTLFDQSPVASSHVYEDGLNAHTITATVADDDGGVAVATIAAIGTGNSPSGFETPVRDGDAYHAGRVLPLKLSVASCGGVRVTDLSPRVMLTRLGPGGGVIDLPAGNSGDRMRAAGGQYVYQLSTKNLDPGVYRIAAVDPSFVAAAQVTIVLR